MSLKSTPRDEKFTFEQEEMEQTIVSIAIRSYLPSISVNIIGTLRSKKKRGEDVYASQTIDIERALKKTYGR